jgi:hypothetical protein
MKRAARFFFHLAAGVSGVLFLVAVGLWIAGYASGYVLKLDSTYDHREFAVSRGGVLVLSMTRAGESERVASSARNWVWYHGPPFDPPWRVFVGCENYGPPTAGFFFQRTASVGAKGFLILLPLPFLVALFAPLPLVDLIRIRRHRRRVRRLAAGLCVRCGYDLRATPQKCPECGAVPIAPPV